MMRAVLQIIRDTFRDIWADLWTMLVCNLIWLIANVLIIPGPPATLALVYYGNRIAHGEVTDLSDFWKAFRRYWGPAWRWGGINLFIILFLVADIAVTGQLSQVLWKSYLQGLYLVLLAVWLSIQFFALPFLYEQETMSVRIAMRNGSVMFAKNIGFGVALLVFLMLILVASTVVFMLSLMFGAVFTSCASNRAVLNRLENVNQLRESV